MLLNIILSCRYTSTSPECGHGSQILFVKCCGHFLRFMMRAARSTDDFLLDLMTLYIRWRIQSKKVPFARFSFLLPPLCDKPSMIKVKNSSLCSCGCSHFYIGICVTVGFHVSFMITSAPVALCVGPYVQHWHVGVMKTQRRYKLSMLLC